MAKIEQAMERDKYMFPNEAAAFGLIDKVLSRPQPIKEMTEN